MSSVRSVRLARAAVLGVSIGIALGVMPAAARLPEYPFYRPKPATVTSFRQIDRQMTLARIVEDDIPPTLTSRKSGLNPRLVSLLSQVERHFGKPVTITSGCRSVQSNRRAGGARESFHLHCMAADIRIAGVSESQVLHFVRALPGRGGVGTYCRNSIVHVDVGPRREWYQGCGGGKKIARKKTVNWRRA